MILTGKARLAGVIGWPVSHSRSPLLHGHWLERHSIDGAYVPLAVQPDDFADALRCLPRLGFRGANITVPHKQAAFETVDQTTERARRIGAVNTVVVGEDGSLLGDNTDGFGFLENLKQGAPHWSPADGPAVVLGAGGAARAVVAALLDAGVHEVRLVNRTLIRAEHLAEDVGGSKTGAITIGRWEGRETLLAGARLVVNTTTLGMDGNEPLDLCLDPLPPEAVVTDIVYTPLHTPLLVLAEAAGLATVDGLGMLLHQARPGFKAWFGVEPQVDDALRRVVLEDLHRAAE